MFESILSLHRHECKGRQHLGEQGSWTKHKLEKYPQALVMFSELQRIPEPMDRVLHTIETLKAYAYRLSLNEV